MRGCLPAASIERYLAQCSCYTPCLSMAAYRDEDVGQRARLKALQQEAVQQDEQLVELRRELLGKGWVPRTTEVSVHRWLVILVAAATLLTAAIHFFFLDPRHQTANLLF